MCSERVTNIFCGLCKTYKYFQCAVNIYHFTSLWNKSRVHKCIALDDMSFIFYSSLFVLFRPLSLRMQRGTAQSQELTLKRWGWQRIWWRECRSMGGWVHSMTVPSTLLKQPFITVVNWLVHASPPCHLIAWISSQGEMDLNMIQHTVWFPFIVNGQNSLHAVNLIFTYCYI